MDVIPLPPKTVSCSHLDHDRNIRTVHGGGEVAFAQSLFCAIVRLKMYCEYVSCILYILYTVYIQSLICVLYGCNLCSILF